MDVASRDDPTVVGYLHELTVMLDAAATRDEALRLFAAT